MNTEKTTKRKLSKNSNDKDEKKLKIKKSKEEPIDVKQKDKNSSDNQLNSNEFDFTFSKLPHEILLIIFKNLNIKEICQMASVCKSWRQAAYDEILWYHINLSDSCLNLKRLWKLFRHRCFINAQSIHLCGNLKNAHYNKNQRSVSKALMDKLNKSCLKLRKLEIKYSDLSSIEINDIPSNIEELKLVRCEIPMKWFEKNQLNNLRVLDLSGSSAICTTHLRDLSKNCKNTLKILNLKNCYRIDDKSIEVLVNEKFDQITDLDLEWTNITQYGLQLICTRLSKSIDNLNLKNCKHIVFNKENLDFIRNSFLSNSSFKLIK